MKHRYKQQGLVLLAAQGIHHPSQYLNTFIALTQTLELGQKIVVVGDHDGLPTPLINEPDWLMLYNPCYPTPMTSSIQYALHALNPSIESVIICRTDQLKTTVEHLSSLLDFQKIHPTKMIHLSDAQSFPLGIPKQQFVDWYRLKSSDCDCLTRLLQKHTSIALL